MHRLTARERDVVQRLIAGRTNKEIARDLAISPHTVRDHVSAMLDRFGVDNRAALAAAAVAVVVSGAAGAG
ncbi:MAG: response regulator transcription factor [Betaproteobacteria bacterium]|jgi:DNA-binding CsgD family transcriptional regulator